MSKLAIDNLQILWKILISILQISKMFHSHTVQAAGKVIYASFILIVLWIFTTADLKSLLSCICLFESTRVLLAQ